MLTFILSCTFLTFVIVTFKKNGLLGAVAKNTAEDARDLGFDSRAGQVGRLTTAATFFWSCVEQALNRGDELLQSLNASA